MVSETTVISFFRKSFGYIERNPPVFDFDILSLLKMRGNYHIIIYERRRKQTLLPGNGKFISVKAILSGVPPERPRPKVVGASFSITMVSALTFAF
jgi:hypothetical protein